MKNRMLILAAALAAACGCERTGAPAAPASAGREGAAYRNAMANYAAGRIDAAADGFRDAVKENPANADARFQLAVLLQDVRRDYIGALACYRDYMLLAPSGERVAIAQERAAQCVRLAAGEIAKKANLADVSAMTKELESAKEASAALRKELDGALKRLAETESKNATLEKELAGLRRVVGRWRDAPEPSAPSAARAAPSAVPAAAGDEAAAPAAAGAASKAAAAKAAADDAEKPLAPNPKALALFEEEEREEAAAAKENPPKTPAAKRVHVVEEGETLGEIAKKYYGRKSAWRKIQDANKTKVPQDGKVQAGQELEIP